LWRPSLAETVDVLYGHLTQPTPMITYKIARSVVRHAFSHSAPLNVILSSCNLATSKAEKRANSEVLKMVWDLGADRNVKTFDIRDKKLTIPTGHIRLRRDVIIQVKADFIYVENSAEAFFWAQFRKSFALTNIELGVIASVFRRTFLDASDRPIELEIFDLSEPEKAKQRNPRLLRLSDLSVISNNDVLDRLQRVVDAYDIVCAKDIDWASFRQRKRPSSHETDYQGRLF
jgi:hypothetical protein